MAIASIVALSLGPLAALLAAKIKLRRQATGMFEKVLIANRGEIACRIMRTALDMDIATVAVYSDADRTAMHVEMADEAVHIGTGPATDSYLVIERIIKAAKDTGADAIHPGYGFLAENPEFSEACAKAGIIFVGPSPDAMRALGGKADAKTIAEKAGVPVVPGYQGAAQDVETLAGEAERIGYPVMIKAVAGGGGRGMRLVEDKKDFAAALESATREAASAFGNSTVLIEKRVIEPRHIEVQVFGDSHGNVVHMYERDCTLQRRNQKVVEEAPAPDMSPDLRARMTKDAVALTRMVGYEGAGTIEFLVEGGALDADAAYYFIEMNTRLQVEHPVTEEVTGLDLVEWQFLVAAGETLPRTQDEIIIDGHAIEVRVCAEDPARDFAPSIGTIARMELPIEDGFDDDMPYDGYVRVETGFDSNSEVSPFYDSLIAKIIHTGSDREEALQGLRDDLEETRLLGLKTNISFLYALLGHPDVVSGNMTTGLIGEHLSDLTSTEVDPSAIAAGARALIAAEAARLERSLPSLGGVDPWDSDNAFHLANELPGKTASSTKPDSSTDRESISSRRLKRPVLVDGDPNEIELIWTDGHLTISVEGENATWPDEVVSEWLGEVTSFYENGHAQAVPGRGAYVLHNLNHIQVAWPTYDAAALEKTDGSGTIRAPINGRVAKVHVAIGDVVEENMPIAIVEAMKMEHVLTSPRAGIIKQVAFAEGDQVSEGAIIATLAEEDGT